MRGGRQRAGAPEDPRDMKTQGGEEKSLERNKRHGPPHRLWDPVGTEPDSGPGGGGLYRFAVLSKMADRRIEGERRS